MTSSFRQSLVTRVTGKLFISTVASVTNRDELSIWIRTLITNYIHVKQEVLSVGLVYSLMFTYISLSLFQEPRNQIPHHLFWHTMRHFTSNGITTNSVAAMSNLTSPASRPSCLAHGCSTASTKVDHCVWERGPMELFMLRNLRAFKNLYVSRSSRAQALSPQIWTS